MRISRRKFVGTSLAGAASFWIDGYASKSHTAEPQPQLPDEDGYKLWLRYMPPGNAAQSYRRIVSQIRVVGTSATCGIIRDELRSASTAMLGSAVSIGESVVANGTVI